MAETIKRHALALPRLDARTQVILTWFYQPDREHTPESLRAHQQEVAGANPSLPQRAGKAYALLMRELPRMREMDARPRRKGAPYEVLIFSERRQNLDPMEMAKILAEMALSEARKQHHEADDQDSAA